MHACGNSDERINHISRISNMVRCVTTRNQLLFYFSKVRAGKLDYIFCKLDNSLLSLTKIVNLSGEERFIYKKTALTSFV